MSTKQNRKDRYDEDFKNVPSGSTCINPVASTRLHSAENNSVSATALAAGLTITQPLETDDGEVSPAKQGERASKT